ncbi:hypothetical protein HOY82DRAFT_624834 [Tuber indicum]|nr:hypothetical protein HOY82DRAFT_624834 [Tuber indicum]
MAQPPSPAAIGDHLLGVQNDLQGVKNHSQGIQDAVGLIANERALVGLHAMQQQMNANHLQMVALIDQQLLLVRLHNSTISNHAPLRYPVGIQVGLELPATRHALSQMTGNQSQAVSVLLHLPGLPAAATVGERRSQIAEYLGRPDVIKSYYTALQPANRTTKSYQSALSPAPAEQRASICAVSGGQGGAGGYFGVLRWGFRVCGGLVENYLVYCACLTLPTFHDLQQQMLKIGEVTMQCAHTPKDLM